MVVKDRVGSVSLHLLEGAGQRSYSLVLPLGTIFTLSALDHLPEFPIPACRSSTYGRPQDFPKLPGGFDVFLNTSWVTSARDFRPSCTHALKAFILPSSRSVARYISTAR